MPIINRIADYAGELTKWRRYIHQNPELGFEEYGTADFVAEKLSAMGVTVHRGLAGTGVVGSLTVGSGQGPAIGLRADMDALPILERGAHAHDLDRTDLDMDTADVETLPCHAGACAPLTHAG